MNRNVEIKASVGSLAVIRDRVKVLADDGPYVLEQVDTFFASPGGRLKLRQLVGSAEAALIYYERPDCTGPKESHYVVHRTQDAANLEIALSRAIGVRGTVRKRREVFLIGQTRVHLDDVEGLGVFVELEVVLRPEQDPAEGIAITTGLMERLGIPSDPLVDHAYIDLLLARKAAL
jgi:predicted adenylyl cyclase CyaB